MCDAGVMNVYVGEGGINGWVGVLLGMSVGKDGAYMQEEFGLCEGWWVATFG